MRTYPNFEDYLIWSLKTKITEGTIDRNNLINLSPLQSQLTSNSLVKKEMLAEHWTRASLNWKSQADHILR